MENKHTHTGNQLELVSRSLDVYGGLPISAKVPWKIGEQSSQFHYLKQFQSFDQ
jgi:hypothetical protein